MNHGPNFRTKTLPDIVSDLLKAGSQDALPVASARLESIELFARAIGFTDEFLKTRPINDVVEAVVKQLASWDALRRTGVNPDAPPAELAAAEILRKSAVESLAKVEELLKDFLNANPNSPINLLGYRKDANGVVSLTLPLDGNILAFARALNEEAERRGMRRVFDVSQDSHAFWIPHELTTHCRTVPGKTYTFSIPATSLKLTHKAMIDERGPVPPLGAIALAEACERLFSLGESSLFTVNDGEKAVRGKSLGFAVKWVPSVGVKVFGDNGQIRADTACAIEAK